MTALHPNLSYTEVCTKALHCNYEFYQFADFSVIEWQMAKKHG